MRRLRWWQLAIAILLTPAAVLGVFFAYIAWIGRDNGRASACHGEVGGGWLEQGRRLPYAGDNYSAYSLTGYALGRTFVHGAVRDAMRASYDRLARERPELRFIYAETGWPWGGRFAPHRTHRNGTAVDFHVPVRSRDGHVAWLPTTFANHLGYEIEFDKQGRFGNLTLDFEAMALHLLALDDAARAAGIGIRRVIFDVDLQPLLFATLQGQRLRERVAFDKGQAWVRHDEHYHVDFEVECAPLQRP